jgi:hypothetical protein
MIGFLVRKAISGLLGGSSNGPKQEEYVLDDALLRKTIYESIQTLEQFRKDMERELVKIMRMEAATLSAKLALSTPPLNGRGIADANENIEEQINYIFKPLESIPFGELVLAKQWGAVASYNFKFKSKRLQTAYDTQNWDVVHKAFAKGGMGKFSAYSGDPITPVPIPNNLLHRTARDSDGMLNGRRFHITGAKDIAQSRIDAQVAAAKKAIGTMAGGWVSCYMKLQGTGYSLPADYAKKGKGYVVTKWSGEQKEITITNEFGNFAGYLDQRRATFQFIIDDAVKQIDIRFVRNCETILSKLNMK